MNQSSSSESSLGPIPNRTDRARVIIDCDPGLDDAAALVLANHFTDIVGITTVGGNAPLADVTTNALLSTQVFGIDAEVHAGAERPLVAEPRHAPEIHGEHGFEGPTLPELTRAATSRHGVDYLIETIRAEEGLWLIPTGPLTNVAMAVRRAPDLVDRLAGISFMGGSATFGNHTPVGEFNVLVDPEAAAVVMAAGGHILMAGLDLTHQFVVDDELADSLRAVGNPGGLMLADLVVSYLDNVEAIRGERRGGLHDPCAVLAVSHPDVIDHVLRHVTVELNGALTRGMTIVDQRPSAGVDDGGGNVWHGHTLAAATARDLLIEAVAAHG